MMHLAIVLLLFFQVTVLNAFGGFHRAGSGSSELSLLGVVSLLPLVSRFVGLLLSGKGPGRMLCAAAILRIWLGELPLSLALMQLLLLRGLEVGAGLAGLASALPIATCASACLLHLVFAGRPGRALPGKLRRALLWSIAVCVLPWASAMPALLS